MSLKYYEDEAKRWPALCATYAHMGDEEIELGIRRLARAFSLPLKHTSISLTRGCRHSRAGKWSITINRDAANWLLIAHEVGHTYWYKKYSFKRREGRNAHGPQLTRIVDRFCEWITAQGWHRGTLAHEVALAEVNATQQAQERALVAAQPCPIDVRIAHKAAQVKRLTTKIKGLTSRLKRAQRSLAALNRVKAKGSL